MSIYYEDDLVTLHLGDCREVDWRNADTLVTDPPYPNNAGWFDDGVPIARDIIRGWDRPAIVFWNECEFPPYRTPPVAVHIWHRPNVNGRPYEPAFHFHPDGRKRRSLLLTHSFIHSGVGPGSAEYVGHPTQKPVAIMQKLLTLTDGTIADPFAGSGSTLVAAKNSGRRAIGSEVDERYCETIANRLAQDTLFGGAA